MSHRTASTFLQTRVAFFGNGVAIIACALHEKIAAAIERRRIRAALGRLDDYLLKDMGIARSDIERISRWSHPPRN